MPAKAGIQSNQISNQIIEQILLLRIRFLDQSQIPLSIPYLNFSVKAVANGTMLSFLFLNSPAHRVKDFRTKANSLAISRKRFPATSRSDSAPQGD